MGRRDFAADMGGASTGGIDVVDTVGGLRLAMAQRAGVLGSLPKTKLVGILVDLGLGGVKTASKADCIEAILLAEFDVTATDQVLDVPVMH